MLPPGRAEPRIRITAYKRHAALVFAACLCYDSGVVKRTRTAALPAFAHTKEGNTMKNNDFITVTGWMFSLLSLMIAVYMLGKGL